MMTHYADGNPYAAGKSPLFSGSDIVESVCIDMKEQMQLLGLW